MISWKSLALHLTLLGIAAVVAVMVWTKEDAPKAAKRAEVEVWSGRPEQISSIEFESKDKKVRIEPKKDKNGDWYVGHVDKTVTVRTPPSPHGGPDGGLDGGPEGPGLESKKESVVFVGVEQAHKLAESLAPLMALRAIGKVEDARKEEFGFDKPEGTLRVTVSGKQHVLTLGGTTPGGADRYAQLDSGEVYAVPGSIAQNLMFADSRLVERELHGFKPDEVGKVKIEQGGKSRELVRMDDKRDGWADAAAPGTLDETAGNWMTKLGRLRITQYVEKPTPEPAPGRALVSVKYLAKGGHELGHIELYKGPPAASSGKPTYLVQTEQTRWYAEVIPSTAEQVEQDLSSVVK
ncbi:MAG: DUF4340 domain-containing protein [Myxococcales bacterium]|nr:DUF4340 domain-containing protein [Myxococcales bacterium]MCB9580878.1 DUF4340 domain-containing protein [Polyangiaceae bacterium]